MICFDLCAFIFLFVINIYPWIRWKCKTLRASMGIPGPVCVPFLGDVVFAMKYQKDCFATLAEYIDVYPECFKYWSGGELYVVVSEPQLMKIVLSKTCSAKPHRVAEAWAALAGVGIFTMSAHEETHVWRSHCNIMKESFSVDRVSVNYSQRLNNCDILLKALETNVDVVETNIFRHASDVLCECIFGTNLHFSNGKRDYVYDALKSINVLLIKNATNISWCESSKLKDEQERCLKIGNNFSFEIYSQIKKHHEYIMTDNIKEDTLAGCFIKAIRIGNMSECEVQNEIMNIYIKGVIPVVATICNLLKALADNPKCQLRLYEEINECKSVDTPRLPYMGMCLREICRLYPTGSLQFRRATEGFYYDRMNVHIPSGTNFVIPTRVVNRDARFWRDPQTFSPERWDAPLDPYLAAVWDPYSLGPRRCFGRTFAEALIKSTLIEIVKNFESQWVRRTCIAAGSIEFSPTYNRLGYGLSVKPRYEIYNKHTTKRSFVFL